MTLKLIFFQGRFNGLSNLVGARCGLHSTAYSAQRSHNVGGFASVAQRCDALQIAVAAAGYAQIAHYAVLHLKFDESAACALWSVLIFHIIYMYTKSGQIFDLTAGGNLVPEAGLEPAQPQ